MSDRMSANRNKSPPTIGENRRWSTATPLPQGTFVYDRKSIIFHWVTAVLVAALWIIAQIIDDFPAGPLRVDARSVHISLGITLAVVLALRLSWRNRGVGALHPDREGRLDRLAAFGHWSLYGLAILAVILGMMNALARGDSIFNLFSLPDLAHGDRSVRNVIGRIHGWVANTLLILAIGHALLALFHHYVLRDGVMRRMVPGWGRPKGTAGERS
ncbi:MAG: cytochrome b [Hyphomicrobiales bacterium]|nr:cytochrome b [Hyphomicrobiales bacterium]MBV9976745.1 cytochrome b [Hyphomicrobiales bacterium]